MSYERALIAWALASPARPLPLVRYAALWLAARLVWARLKVTGAL
jgi:uncharacterized protein involved in response to NO